MTKRNSDIRALSMRWLRVSVTVLVMLSENGVARRTLLLGSRSIPIWALLGNSENCIFNLQKRNVCSAFLLADHREAFIQRESLLFRPCGIRSSSVKVENDFCDKDLGADLSG